jgi:energy-coupling factor transporter ATP-binding protein EcfA2
MPDPLPSEEIFDWSQKQPAWRQDALRRILTGPFTQTDENECLELLKAEQGLLKTKLTPNALSKGHLPAYSQSATTLRLTALDQVSNVNRLSSDAALTFTSNGITIIYGDNGSGKTGFIRILKKACRAKDHERILPNIYAAVGNKSPASARFSLQDSGTILAPIVWSDDGKPADDVLGRIAIFDSKCAHVHVDSENRLEVVPHNLDCFEKLAQVSDKLRSRLKAESEALTKQLAGALPEPAVDTTAAAFIAQLAKKTDKDLDASTKWEASDDKRLSELAELLKDPIAEAKRCERLSANLKEYSESLARASSELTDTKITEIWSLRKAATSARESANASASSAFSSEPLSGVGDETWRALFDAARIYSEQYAYPGQQFPVTQPDSNCVLCQQTLEEGARDRFVRFAEFVNGAMNEKAKAAETASAEATTRITVDKLPISDMAKETKDHLSKNLTDAFKEIEAYRAALIQRREDALTQKEVVLALPPDPKTIIEAEQIALNSVAKRARELAGQNAATAETTRKEHAELAGRKMLHDNKTELSRRIKIFGDLAKIDGCVKACATKPISDQGSKLLKVHVSIALAKALKGEQGKLGISNIPLELSDRTPKGVIQHQLKLNGATLAADTSSVLSEGEHRAAALAVFLAELTMYKGADAIIIDDPVSSLDHERRKRMAERLVGEAKKRQVVVFTHDLVFLSEARFYAAQLQVPIEVIGIRRGPNGFGALDPDGEPWVSKQLPGRRNWLTQQLAQLKKLHAANSADYEQQLRYFYDRLRESWEKLIEEKIFAQVIGRFQPGVETKRLQEAVIDDDIVSQVHFGMSSVSMFTGHDRAAAKGGALPDPDECKKQLDAFTACIDEVDAKSKIAKKSRDGKVKPPK